MSETIYPVGRIDPREQFKAQRTAIVDAIVVMVDGRAFNGDEISQNRMARAVIGMQAAGVPTINWTLADNTVIEATAAQLAQALALAGAAQADAWVMR